MPEKTNVVQYSDAQVTQMVNLLRVIPVQGPQAVKAMGLIYEILAHPIPAAPTEDKNTEG